MVAIGCAALMLASFATIPSRADGGAYGPDTCLNGYVWRGAFPGDHVCVTSAVRDQAQQDNRLADARRSPTGGPYGRDTCLPGFIWRGAGPADHVCVTALTWRQTQDDNLAAQARRNALDLMVATYRPRDTCDGSDSCQTTNPAAYYALRVARINVGTALVVLCNHGTQGERGNASRCRSAHDRVLNSWRVAVVPSPSGPGGLLRWFTTGMPRCPGAKDSYFRVRDPVSGLWSASRGVTTKCSVL